MNEELIYTETTRTEEHFSGEAKKLLESGVRLNAIAAGLLCVVFELMIAGNVVDDESKINWLRKLVDEYERMTSNAESPVKFLS